MATEKDDTDPSSPGALRSPSPRSGRAAGYVAAESEPASGRRPTTDPGLGPAGSSGTSVARRPGTGLVVPPPSVRPPALQNAITPPELTPIAAAPSRTKDSVELLLEGMAGPRPDRRKTTPQSDGEASAMYHAEHGVRPSRTSSDPAPKVLVERSAPGLGVTVRREGFPPARNDANEAARESRESQSTFVPARVLRRRIAVALVAAILIVMVLFVVFQLAAPNRVVPPAATAARASKVVPPAPSPPVPPTATITAAAMAATAAATAAPPTPAAAPVPVETATAPTDDPSSKTHGHHKGAPAGSASGDLGEFKTTF